MNFTYICSRYRGDKEYSVEFNEFVAAFVCRSVMNLKRNKSFPIAPHLYMPRFLDDNNKHDREVALETGLAILCLCKDMVVIMINGIVSEGMQREIEKAKELKIPITYMNFKKEDFQQEMEKVTCR